MTKTLTRLGDRLMGLVLPKADAGACSTHAGAYCGCEAPHGGPLTEWYANCYGVCVSSGTPC
jgi:hypothetical protein